MDKARYDEWPSYKHVHVTHLPAVASMSNTSLHNIRGRIIDKTVSTLIAYRKNCAAATAPSQVCLHSAIMPSC